MASHRQVSFDEDLLCGPAFLDVFAGGQRIGKLDRFGVERGGFCGDRLLAERCQRCHGVECLSLDDRRRVAAVEHGTYFADGIVIAADELQR